MTIGIRRFLAPGALVAFLLSCRANEPSAVTVVGEDYAFEAPDTLDPGPTVFRFENQGAVDHEMILVLLKEGVTLDQVLAAAREGGDPEEFVEAGSAGILVAGPGGTTPAGLLVDLLPGRTYALICNFKDSEEAPPHTALGMTASVEVR